MSQRNWFNEDEATSPVPGDLPLPEARLELPSAGQSGFPEEDEPLSPQMENYFFSEEESEAETIAPTPASPKTEEVKDPTDIPLMEAAEPGAKSLLGDMAKASPIDEEEEGFFSEKGATVLDPQQARDSEVEMASSEDPNPWYETAPSFDLEIKPFGQNPLSIGMAPNAVNEAFPDGLPASNEDPVNTIPNALARGWKTAQKSFSFVAGAAGLPGQMQVQADLGREIEQIPRDQATSKLEAAVNSEDPWGATKELVRSQGAVGMAALGAEAVLSLGTESGAMFLPGTLALGALRVPPFAAGFLNSLSLEYSSAFMEGLKASGVDTSDPDAVEKALQDEAFLTNIRQASWAKAIPVAAFDAITLGLGGKMAKGIYRKVIKRLGRNQLGRVTGYAAAGAGTIPPAMATGMTGEASGQAAQQAVFAAQAGQEIDLETLVPRDRFSVLAEGIGEIGGPLTASLAFETVPGLARQTLKPAIDPMTEYLRQSGAPQTAQAVAQTNQTPQPVSDEDRKAFTNRVAQAPAYAGRTEAYPETPPAEGELTDFSKLASVIDEIIKRGKSEKRQTQPKEEPAAPETAQTSTGETPSAPATTDQPAPAQQGGEASQTPLTEPVAAAEPVAYERAVDYAVDWYMTKKRPQLLSENMMTERDVFPSQTTYGDFAVEILQLLEASGIDGPKTVEESKIYFTNVASRIRARVAGEPPEADAGGGGDTPEPDAPISIKDNMSAVEFLGSAIQNLTRDEAKKPKLKKLSGKNVTGEITLPQESEAYVQMLNEMPEAPGENDALLQADKYFRGKIGAILNHNPGLQGLDLDRLRNAARLRLQRQIRKKYQQLRRRGSLTEGQAAERFMTDVLPKINPATVFRSVYSDFGRKLARRSAARVGLQSAVSLDAPFDRDSSLTFGDILEDKSDTDQDEQVLADIGRNARNEYFNSLQKDIAKNLIFRAAMNLKPGADISKDAGRLRKIQDALEASGETVDFDKLQKMSFDLMNDFREKVSAKVNADYERYQTTGVIPDLVAGPENMKYLTSGKEITGPYVGRADRDAQALVDETLEQLLANGLITEQQAVVIQDILDENPRKSGSIAAMRELQTMLSSAQVTSRVKEPVTRVVSNNPPIADQTPDEFALMDVQRQGATMIFQAHLLGRRGALLADTAGLGKTGTALAAAKMISKDITRRLRQTTKEEAFPGKIIYITESRELIESAAGGARAQLSARNIPADRVYFKTYDDYSKGKIDFEDADVIIFDEAQNLKNPESERARLAKIGTAFHIYVSATPADKLKSVKYFLPRITGRPMAEIENALANSPDKGETIASYIEQAGASYAYIRREPVRGLPEANQIELSLPEQMQENLRIIDNYHQLRLDALSEKLLNGSVTEQQADSERLKIMADRKRSLERYVEMNKTEQAYFLAQEALEAGRQVLIFGEAVNPTHFPELGVTEPAPSALEMLKARFEKDGIGVAVIYGEGGDAMIADINDFMRGNKKVALLTPYKGGAGLNLDDQTGERPRTVINMTINEAADKDEQMRSRAGGRLSSKSDVEYLELITKTATDQDRQELRAKKQRILKVTQGAAPDTRDTNQLLLEFQDVIVTNQKPVLQMPDVDPTMAPKYNDTAKTRERMNRQLVDDRITTLRALERNAVQRLAQSLDELGFRGMRIEFAEYSGKAVWTDWTRMSFNTIYVNPKTLAGSLDVVSSSEGELGGLFLRAMALEEVHHNQVYLLTENFSKQLFENQIASMQLGTKEAFRRVYTTILRGVYDEMSPAMRADIASRYRKSAMSPEMTAMEFLRSLYQELKLEYTTEDFLTEDRRQALARKLQGVPKDGMIRMWLELLRQSVLSLLRKAEKTFAQSPMLSNMLDATDNMIQYLTDTGPPFGKDEIFRSSMYQELRKMFNLGPVPTQQNVNEEGQAPIRLSKGDREKLLEKINNEVSKPAAVIDGVLLSDVPSSTRGLSGRVYGGRYAWVKADKLQGSHLKNFGPNPKYPFLNTRDYASSQGDQDKVLSGAQNFQPDMFVTNSLSANGGLQTVIRGKRSGDFYLAAGNGRHLIAQYATEMAGIKGVKNLEDLVNRMAEVANKEGVALPDDLNSYRLVKVLDFEIDEADKSMKGEIEEIISDLNDGGGRQTSALGKSEQDLPTILGNETLKAQLEKFATGEKELTSNAASEFVRQAVGLKAVNQLERGFLSEPSERYSALLYVRYLLTRAYSSPNIPMVVAGKNMQVLYAQEVMYFSDENWGMASKLLRVNALSGILGDKGKALKSAIDQLLYFLATQTTKEKEGAKADFFSFLDSTKQREDELMTAMLSPEEAEVQRKMEQITDLLQSQLEKRKHRQTQKIVTDVAKSRSRINRLILAMGDHLYTSYLEKKQDLKGATKLDLGDEVDAVEYMIQVIKARIASNPNAFRQSEEDAEYDPVSSPEVEGGDFDQPITADTDPDSEENRELLDPVINDEELKPENLVWQAWQEEGDVDFGFKSRTAYNRLLTYLDQAGYGKYLRFRKILESMAQDEAWVEEMGKRLDEEVELQDQMDKAKGKSITRKMDLLKMGIPTKDETFELMRLTNVYAKDGRVAQLLEPILGKIDYPKVSSAILNQRDEAVAMMTRAQEEVERLVKAKEYRILRENPRFAAEAAYLLEEINDAYRKYITKNVSPIVLESVEQQDKKEKAQSRERVAKLQAAKVRDVFKSVRIDAAIEQIKRNSIQTYKATPSINQRIAPVLKSIEEVGQNLNALAVARDVSMQKLMDMTRMEYRELAAEVEDTDLKKPDRQRRISKITGGRGEMFAKRQEISKVLGINEQINRHRMVEQRLLLVLNELESFKDQTRVTAEETVNEKKQLTKAEIENLPVKTLTEMIRRKFDMPGPLNLPGELATVETVKEKPGLPIYAGTIKWQDPRPGKGFVQARTLSQAVSRAPGKPVYNTVIVSFLTETGEVPLPTFTNGRPITQEEGKQLTAAYYEKGGSSIIATPQIARGSLNIVRIEPVGMFLRGDKFYSPAPPAIKPAPKIKVLDLPMAQRYSKPEPEVNARGERWYEFTLDPENQRSHQRVYVRATNHLDAIRKAVEKMTEKGQTLLYKGKLYSQRQPERTIRVPTEQTETDTTAGLTPDELDLRRAIQRADVEKIRKLIESGRAKDEDYIWYAKQEAEAIITSLYEQGLELQDPEVITIAKEFGFIDVTGKQKPDLRRLRRLREIAVSKRTPKTMGVSRNVGRSGLVKDVGVNMALFGNQSKTKEVPAPEQVFKLQEMPRKTSAEVLEEIAKTNGTTVEELRQVNNLTGAALAPGASILIPGTTRSVKIPDYNLVQEGPSLLKVARQYGVTREELAKANNLPEDYIVKPGDEIVIPATKFRDTTKDLVDRLFKERVYEAGPTMLRVNTPPPGIKIVNEADEPMAAATVDPEEQRKKDLLANADMPEKAKQAVNKSQIENETFMESLARLKKVLDELKKDSPGLFQRGVTSQRLEEPMAAAEVEKPLWQENKQTRQKHTFTLSIRPYPVEITEAFGRKEAIGKNLAKLFKKNQTLLFNGQRFSQRQIGLLTYLINNHRGWSDPVRRIDYNEDGSIDQPVAAGEVEPPTGEEAEMIYRARRRSQKREGKRKIRGFVKTYGNDGEIDRDLRDATALAGIRYHVRTQPLRAEEAMDVIAKAGGTIAVARELISPETSNPGLMAMTSNPIEFDNLVILNSILLKQLDRIYKAAKLDKDQHTATEAMNLSLQLAGKQAELGTKLGRGLAAFAAYTRLSPAGWRYFMTQQFEQARLEQINLLPEQFERVTVSAKSAVASAFEKVVAQPDLKKLLDKIDELANGKAWSAMLKRAEKVAKIAGEATGKDKAKREKEFEKILKDTKQLIAMIKKQKDEMAGLQLESAISEGVAAALMKGVDSPEETAEQLGITKEEVLENFEPAQDRLDEVRQKSVDELRAILPEELRDKPLNWIFDGEEPAAASTPEESIEDGDSVEEELAEAEEIQTSKMLKKFLVDFGKALRDRDKEKSLPQEKINAIVRRILRENLQKAAPELSLRRAKLSTLDRQTKAITRFRKALSVWKEVQGTAGDDAFRESAATSLNKLLPPGQTEIVLKALDAALEQPYTKADLKAFLTIRNSNIRDYLFSRSYELFELRAQVIENLMTELRANGLEVDEKLLAGVMDRIAEQLKETAGEEFRKRLNEEDFKRVPKLKVFREASNDIVKLALLQKLDGTSLLNGLQKQLGLAEGDWTPAPEMLDKITKKAEQVANDPDGPNSRRAIRNTIDLLDMIRKEVGFNLLDVFQSFFYVNIIGGVKTITTNVLAPVNNAMHFALRYSYPTTNKKKRQGMIYALQRVRQAFNQGLAEFLSVISTGDLAGRITFLDNMAGAVGQRKTGRQNIELFLDEDAKYYTKLPAFGWLVPLAKFWYGIGDKNPKFALEIGIPKSVWDGAFSLLKSKPARKLIGKIRTPEYPEKPVRAKISVAGVGALIGRLYTGMDVFWTAFYSELHAAMTAHEITYEQARANVGLERGRLPGPNEATFGDDLENIRINADALMGYDMGSKLKAARQIAREKLSEDSSGRDVPEYHPLAEDLRRQAREARLKSLKRGTLEYRQQFYLNRIRNRAYSSKLPDQADIQKSEARRDKLSKKEIKALDEKILLRNRVVNKLIWESLFMGQWMAQVNQPYGMIGKGAKLFENIVKRQGFRLLAFIQPFFSIVANVYTIWLNWMGMGALKNMGPKSGQLEVFGEGTKEKPEVLRDYEQSSGVVGALSMVMLVVLMASLRVFDDDDDENLNKERWFDITGRGPKDPDQRKALEATGQWQRDSVKFGKTWIKIPVYAPFYLALKAVGDMRDYTKYDVPTHGGMLDLGMEFVARIIGAASRGPFDVPFVSGLKTALDALNTENPNWISEAGSLLSRTVGGIAVPGFVRELDQRVIDPVTREKSGGYLATMLGNLPFLRSVNKPATNVLGEEIRFNNPPQGKPTSVLENYLEIFMTRRAEVDPLFEVLMAKGAWITMPPNRITVMGTRLNDELADEWKMKRAETLRENFRKEGVVEYLWDRSPAEAQIYASRITAAANQIADAHIIDKYPEVEEGIETYMEKKALYGPRGVK